MKLSPIIRRMCAMCPEAWYIFIRSVQLCCVLLLGAAALLAELRFSGGDSYRLIMTARALNETSQAVLLIAVLFSVIIEDVHS